jgi:methyltransferase (TIGR00027 family)
MSLKPKLFSISSSAKGVAYLRSLDISVSNDSLACNFVDKEGKHVATNWLEVYPGVGRQICIRARYIEETVDYYLPKNGGQVISLASGLSTYPYRSTWMEKVKYYAEVDFPDMIKFKKNAINRLTKEGVVSKPLIAIKYVGLDITDDILMEKLKSNGWQSTKKTVFIIEGVSYYLSFHALTKLIKNIKLSSCSGSIVIIDYFPQSCSQTKQFKKVMGMIARGGEATLCCPSTEQVSEIFKHYKIISDVADELERKYYNDDFCVIEMAHILIART